MAPGVGGGEVEAKGEGGGRRLFSEWGDGRGERDGEGRREGERRIDESSNYKGVHL